MVIEMARGQSVVRQLGNTALINGIGTSNMSLSAITMFMALLLSWKKYVGEMEKMGVKEMVEIYQAAYDRYQDGMPK